ncbi:MAG TPA: PPOX class F420-dependent oxidoreductase [Pseudonocardiaceae bacterium]
MYTMSRDEWLSFVSAGARTGKLAVVRTNGAPHVVPIWFVIDSDDEHDYVVFTTASDTIKGRVLRNDPRFSMCVDDEKPPFSFVTIHGEATVSEDLDEMLVWATKLGRRYMGADLAVEIGKRNAVPGELLIRGRITKVTALGAIAD